MHPDGVWIPIILFASFPVMAIGIPIARAFAKRLGQEPYHRSMPPEVTERLARMEQALDSNEQATGSRPSSSSGR